MYQTHFDVSRRDDDMIRILNIENPTGEDLESPCVCSRCFANRDIVTKATLDTFVSEDGEPTSNASFERSEIKSIYYNLYFDNSEQDNSRIREKFPSYDSLESFKNYIVEKFDIQFPTEPEPPRRQNRRVIVNPFSDGVNDDEPVEASTPNQHDLDRRYVVAPNTTFLSKPSVTTNSIRGFVRSY